MNIYEALDYLFERDGNTVYCKDINYCIYSATFKDFQTMFLYVSTVPPTPLTLNSHMMHYEFEKQENK
ncbi:MAG: hypothetical protein ACRC6V_04195 [Bacteroidales bacterium]